MAKFRKTVSLLCASLWVVPHRLAPGPVLSVVEGPVLSVVEGPVLSPGAPGSKASAGGLFALDLTSTFDICYWILDIPYKDLPAVGGAMTDYWVLVGPQSCFYHAVKPDAKTLDFIAKKVFDPDKVYKK
jgi:hypothetical protein